MITIAIAEDHLRMRETISALISSIEGYKVSIEAENGFRLIERLNSIKRIPDIALIDVEMPVMDGLSTTNFITKHYPGIKVLGTSYHLHPSIVHDLLEAGAVGFIAKGSLSKQTLEKAFISVYSGVVYIDDSIKSKKDILSTYRKVDADTAHPDITKKEKTFLELSATAITYEQIADLMNVATESVYNYQKSIRIKTGLRTRQEYILYSIRHGIAKVARLNV